jgi:methyl-accepting chemotaxis protein
MTLGKRIGLGFAGLVGLTLVFGFFSLTQEQRARERTRENADAYFPAIGQALEIERGLLLMRIQFVYFVTIQKPGTMEKGLDLFDQARRQVDTFDAAVATDPALEPLTPRVRALHASMDAYEGGMRRMIDLVQRHQEASDAFAPGLAEWARQGADMVANAAAISQAALEITQDNSRKTIRALAVSASWTGVFLAFSLLFGIGVAWNIAKGISRLLKALSSELEREADLSVTAAGQVSAASRSLAESATRQAASLEETGASLEELSGTTRHNAADAQEAQALGHNAAKTVRQGLQEMVELGRTVRAVQQSSAELNGAMDAIQSSSTSIAKVIRSIDQIAFQTNILALNASVEAARAGTAGAGFAVVAEEVRALAQRSAQAARETAALIEESVRNSRRGVEVTRGVDESIHSIFTQADKVMEALQAVRGKSEEADRAMAAIVQASQEQEAGIAQINEAVAGIDTMVQSNVSNAKETLSAASDLTRQAVHLRSIVGELLHLVDHRPSGKAPGGRLPMAPSAVFLKQREESSFSPELIAN